MVQQFCTCPQTNGKLRLCLDPARLKQVLKRLVLRKPTLNDILPKLNNAQYLSLIDAHSGYYNLKLDEKSSYLTQFTCQFDRYRYKRQQFGGAHAGDMFQRKIDKIFKDLLNVFDITDDILAVGYDVDGKDHDDTVERVLQICRLAYLKLNKDKSHFRGTSSHF